MAFGTRPDEKGQQDEVLSKVDALQRRHRSGGLDALLEGGEEADIPTLTEVLEEPKCPDPLPESVALEHAGIGADAPAPPPAATVEPASAADGGSTPGIAPEIVAAPDAEPGPCPVPEVQVATPSQESLARLQSEIERAVADALAAQLPRAIQDQVIPEVMLQLGDGLNRLRDAMSSTVRGVVQETIEQEVKRALKALLKERMKR